jgi:multidrug efflux system membrane fusion protein
LRGAVPGTVFYPSIAGQPARREHPRVLTKLPNDTSMNLPRRQEILFSLLGFVCVVMAGCNRSAPTAGAGSVPTIPVQTAVSQVRDMPRIVESVGSVQSLRTVAVKAQVDGMIAQIHFREGDEVQAGAPLVSLDRRPFENSLRIARADLANARAEEAKALADLERYKSLDQQDAISKEQFAQLTTKSETTRALVQAKEAAVANSELLLSYTTIKAPIAGRTGQLILHEGALVKANDVSQSIVTLNQLSPIAATFTVPENELNGIRAALGSGSAAVTVMDRTSGVTRSDGKLTFVDNAVDPASGTITLKAMFENTDHVLWPGQFVHVQTHVGVDRNAVVVPTSAVQTGQNGAQVFVVKPDQTVEIRRVRVSRSTGDVSLIAQGLQGSETVITDGQLRLVPGARVESKSLASFLENDKAGAPAEKGAAQDKGAPTE